jgi:hypothetical protein
LPLKAMFETATLGELADRAGLLDWAATAPIAADADASFEEGTI